MSEQHMPPEIRIAALVEIALGQARQAECSIIDSVVPAFFPSRHGPDRVAKILRG